MENIFIPNVLTLNQDSLNEKLLITGVGEKLNASIVIINRWGNEIYFNADYKNNWPPIDQPIEAGLYFYSVSFRGCRTYKGWLQILR